MRTCLLIGLVAVPLLIVGAVIVAAISLIGALVSLVVPLIPFVLLGLLIWAMVRKAPAVAA